MQKKSWYLKIHSSEISPYVILVGDPGRIELFKTFLTDAREVSCEREFLSVTGLYAGEPVTIISTGIGAPAAAIVLEELWEQGAQVVVRAGTAMAMTGPIGHIILAQAAVRMDGTSTSYLPIEYPAVCDFDLFDIYRKTAIEKKLDFKSGFVATCDGFYTHLFHHPVKERIQQRKDETLIKSFAERGVIGADMETSALYAIGWHLKLKCISVLLASVDASTQAMLPATERREKEEGLVSLVLDGLVAYAKKDRGIG